MPFSYRLYCCCVIPRIFAISFCPISLSLRVSFSLSLNFIVFTSFFLQYIYLNVLTLHLFGCIILVWVEVKVMFRVSYRCPGSHYERRTVKEFSSFASAQLYFLLKFHDSYPELRLEVVSDSELEDVSDGS